MTDRADMVTPPVELRSEALQGTSGGQGDSEAASAPSTSTNSTAVLQQDAGFAERTYSPPRANPASSSASRGE